jgi:hypothetical protein
MSSKYDKWEVSTTQAEQPSITTQQRHEEIREAIVDAFDEAKGNTERALKETQKEIPRFKEAVENCQEKIFESARAIADDYIDSQKEIFDLFQQSTWISRLRDGNGTFWSNWMSTLTNRMTEIYANTTSSYVDSLFTATRLTNNVLTTNTDAFKVSTHHEKEFSKISLNNVKALRQKTEHYTKSLNQFGVRDQSSSTEKEIQKK